jgi:hypothetical protein
LAKGEQEMINYYKIDELGIFDRFEDAKDFYLLNLSNENGTLAETAVNYLLADQYLNASNLWCESYQVKFDSLQIFAKQNRDEYMFLMLDLIKSGIADFNAIADKDADAKVLYNRIANIMGGIYSDYSIVSELYRITEVCKNEGLIVDLELSRETNER